MDIIKPKNNNNEDVAIDSNYVVHDNKLLSNILAVNNEDITLDSSIKITADLENGGHQSSFGGCYYYKIGSKVTVNVGVNGLTANTNTQLFTLPKGYKPNHFVSASGLSNGMSTTASIQIASNGNVTVYASTTYAHVHTTFDVFEN